MKIVKSTPEGRVLLMAIRGPGDIVGESSALDGKPQPATVTTLTDVSAVIVSRTRFVHLLHSHPRALLELATFMVDRLREADQRRLEQGAFDVTTRVVRLLLDVANQYGDRIDQSVRVPLTQVEIADSIAASPEAVALALRVLRERGLVTTHRASVEVLRRDNLRALLMERWVT